MTRKMLVGPFDNIRPTLTINLHQLIHRMSPFSGPIGEAEYPT